MLNINAISVTAAYLCLPLAHLLLLVIRDACIHPQGPIGVLIPLPPIGPLTVRLSPSARQQQQQQPNFGVISAFWQLPTASHPLASDVQATEEAYRVLLQPWATAAAYGNVALQARACKVA